MKDLEDEADVMTKKIEQKVVQQVQILHLQFNKKIIIVMFMLPLHKLVVFHRLTSRPTTSTYHYVIWVFTKLSQHKWSGDILYCAEHRLNTFLRHFAWLGKC